LPSNLERPGRAPRQSFGSSAPFPFFASSTELATILAAIGIGPKSEEKWKKKLSRDASWHEKQGKLENKLSGTKRLGVPMHFISVLFIDRLTQGKCTGRSDLYAIDRS